MKRFRNQLNELSDAARHWFHRQAIHRPISSGGAATKINANTGLSCSGGC
jgi:hypothetical protein